LRLIFSTFAMREIRDSCRDLKDVTYRLHPRTPFDVSRSTVPAARWDNSTVSEKCGKSWRPILTVCLFRLIHRLLLAVNRNPSDRDSRSEQHVGCFLPQWRANGWEGRGWRVRNGKLRLHPSSCSRAASKKSRDDVVPRSYSWEDGPRLVG